MYVHGTSVYGTEVDGPSLAITKINSGEQRKQYQCARSNDALLERKDDDEGPKMNRKRLSSL